MSEPNLARRFQSITDQHAGRTALWFSERDQVTYAELNGLANRMARWLTEAGVGRGDVVCIAGTKTRYAFAGIIACLKLGAGYAVVDPDGPAERLDKILATCRPKAFVRDNAPEFVATIATWPDTDVPETDAVTGADVAYIMYTSGSTGTPKGAVITHANVLNLIGWSKEAFAITRDDVITNVNALFFDNSVFDIYTALFNGACLVPFSKEQVRNPQLLVERIDAAGCTLWFSVPSLLIFLQTMKAADGARLRSIRCFVFGGEGYPKPKLKRLYDSYRDSSAFFNVYGPTECTCICSEHRITEHDFSDLRDLPPLGRLVMDFRGLILGDDDCEVPAGEWGELCLLGPNVGQGYYNDLARTAAAFVQNPRNTLFPEIMYKTGDLVRQDPNGTLHIRGRKDNQIKHMGYRIELEEIDAALHRLDYVTEAAAVHSQINGLSRIIAVVAAGREFEDDQLTRDLRRMLPHYMIPSVVVREARLPKNANGKVDRRALAERYA